MTRDETIMATDRIMVGIIGAGTIARAIIEDLQASGAADVCYVLTSRSGRERPSRLANVPWLTNPDEAVARPVDLVIEAAVPEIFARLAPAVLEHSDFCGFSCTALADPMLEAAVRDATAKSGRRLYVPHGAILGLDGLVDGRDVLERVVITTTKSGKSFGLDPGASGVVFEGSTRDACRRFPRNVNVHAAIALAGLGFDKTRSRIVAVPNEPRMRHTIEVSGPGLEWTIQVASQSLGGVTGSYTLASAAGSVRRIIDRSGVVIA
jgi:aspartate dehydrogenase